MKSSEFQSARCLGQVVRLHAHRHRQPLRSATETVARTVATRRVAPLIGVILLLATAVTASEQQPLVSLQYRILGTQLQVSPSALSVPKSIAGSVLVMVANADGSTNASTAQLAAGAYVEATLRGPGFTAQRLVAAPNGPLMLPALNMVGDYELDNIRLVDSATGATRLEGNPSTVPVHVFDQVLISQVTSRPLTTQEIQDIYSGKDTNWSQLGGPNETITTIERPAGSGTRGTFSQYVMDGQQTTPTQTLAKDDSGALGQAVSTTPGAIGYIGTSFIGNGGEYQGKIVPLCIDGQKPSPSAVASNAYKYWNFEHMYTKGQPSGLASSFLNYVQSSAFQPDLADLYYVAASSLSSSAAASHQPSA